MEYNELKMWFRAFRGKRHIHQKDMAKDLKVPASYLSKMENLVVHITENIIKKLSDFYGLKAHEVAFLRQYKYKKKSKIAYFKNRADKVQRQNRKLETAYRLAIAYIQTLQKSEIDNGLELYNYFIEEAERQNGKDNLKRNKRKNTENV